MNYKAMLVLALSLLIAGCGSGKGPGRLTSPPPTGGTPPPGPNPPVVPGIGNNGKIQVNVEAGGTVTSSPNIGSCTGLAECEFSAQRGTVVTLTATPSAGNQFEEWDRCPGPSGTQCVITVEALTWVKAEFDPL